jgi:Flp pilus assembly protein TadD
MSEEKVSEDSMPSEGEPVDNINDGKQDSRRRRQDDVSLTEKKAEENANSQPSMPKLPPEPNAADHDATDAEGLNVKGMNLVRKNELRPALECFELAVKLNPNHSKAWYNKGMSLVSLGESKDEALHCFQKAIEINPFDAEAWNNKGAVLAMLGKERDALTCYERATEIKPSYARAWQNKGLLLARMGNKKEAKQCFKYAAEAGLK